MATADDGQAVSIVCCCRCVHLHHHRDTTKTKNTPLLQAERINRDPNKQVRNAAWMRMNWNAVFAGVLLRKGMWQDEQNR